jgi:hypothetical protein
MTAVYEKDNIGCGPFELLAEFEPVYFSVWTFSATLNVVRRGPKLVANSTQTRSTNTRPNHFTPVHTPMPCVIYEEKRVFGMRSYEGSDLSLSLSLAIRAWYSVWMKADIEETSKSGAQLASLQSYRRFEVAFFPTQKQSVCLWLRGRGRYLLHSSSSDCSCASPDYC